MLICFGILFIIENASILFGVLMLKIDEVCDKREAQQKQQASKPLGSAERRINLRG